MPEVLQFTLANAVTTNATQSAFDLRDITTASIYASGVGGTSATVKLQGTADPLGVNGWADLGTRQSGGGAYSTTPVTVTPAAPVSLYLDPADNINWVRSVSASQTGPMALTVILTGEK